jgi:hypothetical protein
MTTPAGMLQYARTFLRAAEQLETDRRAIFPAHYPVSHYLLGHSIEIAYKAYLLGRGFSEGTLRSRNFGHDLIALKKAAQRVGVAGKVRLTRPQHAAIRYLAGLYGSKGLEYHKVGLKSVPALPVLFDAASLLVRDLRSFCHQRTIAMRAQNPQRAGPLSKL